MTTRARAKAWSLAATAVLALSACLPTPSPPVYPHPPADIESFVVSPSPLVAGHTLTMTLVASHEAAVTSITTWVAGPTHAILPGECSDVTRQQWSGPATHVTVTLTCTLPAIATNGDWLAHVDVFGEDSALAESSVPFVVTGGSDDVSAPTNLTDTTTVPTVAHRGSDVELTVRLDEEHPPITVSGNWRLSTIQYLGPRPEITCDDHVRFTTIDARTSDMTVTCHVPADAVPGSYSGPDVYTFDPLGQQGYVAWAITIVP